MDLKTEFINNIIKVQEEMVAVDLNVDQVEAEILLLENKMKRLIKQSNKFNDIIYNLKRDYNLTMDQKIIIYLLNADRCDLNK